MARLFYDIKRKKSKKKIQANFNPPGRAGSTGCTEPSQRWCLYRETYDSFELSWTDGERGGSIQKGGGRRAHTHMAIVFLNACVEANGKTRRRRKANVFRKCRREKVLIKTATKKLEAKEKVKNSNVNRQPRAKPSVASHLNNESLNRNSAKGKQPKGHWAHVMQKPLAKHGGEGWCYGVIIRQPQGKETEKEIFRTRVFLFFCFVFLWMS